MTNTTEFKSAAQAIEWIDGLRYASEKNGLNNMRALLERLGNPQNSLRCIHVAGTNGKGSTCALLERMLRECGLKTGLYTSPYLMRYGERMRINGIPIEDDAFVRLASRIRREAEALVAQGVRPTWFELGTAIAFLWFAEQRVDAAVIEVGLGGRLDPTNVIMPEICLIGPIGLEHTQQLGDTLEKIAFEKAGIIKPGVLVAIQRQQSESVHQVFLDVAARCASPVMDLEAFAVSDVHGDARGADFVFDGLHARVNLSGRHQIANAALAISGLRLLQKKGWQLETETAIEGLRLAVWPARLEWIDAHTLIDGAHNGHGARALAGYIREFLQGRRIVMVAGMMKDKDVSECAAVYAECVDEAVCTQIAYPRAMPCEELAQILRGHGINAEAVEDEGQAVARARVLAGEEGIVLIAGSLYLAGDVRLMLRDDGGRL